MEPLTTGQIVSQLLMNFVPVWICMVLIFAGSILTKKRTGLYGARR